MWLPGRWAMLGVCTVVCLVGGAAVGCSDDDSTGDPGECGNAIIEGDEQCDRFDLGGASCDTVVPGSNGTLGCSLECAYDVSACVFTTCGDGVAEGNESCDGSDLRGQSCQSQGFSSGTLVCAGASCSFDTSGCSACGDGVNGFDEECDCGVDGANLPDGCSDVNGGPNASCSLSCMLQSYCGDGVTDAGEDCDCGVDAANLPAFCFDVNGGTAMNASCTIDCRDVVQCSLDVWETCVSGSVGTCCDDEWGANTQCTDHPNTTTAFCLRTCATSDDCYWSNYCRAGLSPAQACWVQVCGPSWPDTQMNDYCTVEGVTGTGGGAGWCLPIYRRDDPTDDMFGICIEAGAIAHGQTCPASDLDTTDRSETQCNLGLCSKAAAGDLTGTCLQFCDWEAAYAVAFYGALSTSEVLPCPAGYNCFSESYLDPTTGNRSGDLGYCRPTAATNPTTGFTTCSLITNALVSNPSQTCGDVSTNGRCDFVNFSGGERTDGSLVGVCTTGSAPTVVNAWDPCTLSDVCPVGTSCVRQDVFATVPSGQLRCVPYCDTEHHDGTLADCAVLGAGPTVDGTPVCTSLSQLALPDGPTDQHPSRLGYCALP